MIVVLGCGPAGLMAAQAAAQTSGQKIEILSKKVPSVIRGAMYVHKEIPEVTGDPSGTLRYQKVGTKEGYAQKVYGDPKAPTSWDRFEGEYTYWSMPAVYEVLWNKWESKIHDLKMDYVGMRMLRRTPHISLIINTIPLIKISQFSENYEWESERVFITDTGKAPSDTIIYSGDEGNAWHRMSNICGHRHTEYPHDYDPELAIDGGFWVTKPLRTNFDPDVSFGKRVLCVGRYGKWSKEELAHDAYYDTVQRIQEMNL